MLDVDNRGMVDRLPNDDGRFAPQTEQPDSRSVADAPIGLRLPKLVGASVAAAALILVVIVLVTPPEDTPSSTDNLHAGQHFQSVAPLPPRQEYGLVGLDDEQLTELLQTDPSGVTIVELERELTVLADDLLESYPQDAQALFVAGMAFFDMQRSSRAERALRRSVELSPPQVAPYVGLADTLMLMARDQEAVDVLAAAIAQGRSSSRAIRTLADGLTRLGRLEEAAGILAEDLVDHPTESQNWMRLGQIQIQLHRFQEAETSLRRAIDLETPGRQELIALNTALMRQGKHDEATEVRKQLADLTSQEQDPNRDGKTYQRQFAHTFQRNVALWYGAGAMVCFSHGQHQRAEMVLKRAIALDPQRAMTFVFLTSLYQRCGQLADAMVAQQQLAVLQPENAQHHINLAAMAKQLGRNDVVENALHRACQLETDGFAHFLLAQFYLSQDRAAEAREAAEIAVQGRQSVDTYTLLESVCEAVGDDDGAREAAENARRLAPRRPGMRF